MRERAADQENPLVYLFRRVWKYSSSRQKIVQFWAFFLVATCVSIFVQPFVWRKILQVIETGGGISQKNFGLIGMLLGLSSLSTLLFWAFHGPARVMERMNSFMCRANYRKTLLNGILGLPMEWHTDHHSGDTIDKIEKGTGSVYDFSQDSYEIIYSFARLIGSVGVLAVFYPPAIAIVALFMGIAIWMTVRFDRVLVGEYKELSKCENNIAESVFDTVSNIGTVIILRVEKCVYDALSHIIMQPLALYRKNITRSEIKWFLSSMICSLMTISVLGFYFWSRLNRVLLLADVYLLIQYMDKISDVFFQFVGMYSDTLKRKARVMNCEELTADFRETSLTDHVLPEGWMTICIRNLCFSYEGKNGFRQQLCSINIDLKRGEKIALIGHKGSGKTTFLKVLRDLYHPQSLELFVDGVKVDEGFGGISRAIALVPQTPDIFSTTIRNNITLRAEYSQEEIENAARLACFDEVVSELPKGYESSLKEKGVNLSGGQRQGLALARGLIAAKHKDILLLDEQTSSQDAANENQIYENIFAEFEGKTIIASVHGLHLLDKFDRILVFRDGKIVGDGTRDELASTCEHFQDLLNRRRRQAKIQEDLLCAV